MIAGAIFKCTWKLLARQEDAPDAGDLERGWGEVLAAAALQGAIAGAVKAALNRGYLIHRHHPQEPGTRSGRRSPGPRRAPPSRGCRAIPRCNAAMQEGEPR
ncbi:MAG: rane protein [Actinoallomurus sp.]|nr:rane protein [Actinoallomurus sp.]